ncbi:mitochondrial escape protein 2 [Nowakowskiella sp. JEL0078]|nr:mitochondrial escape protein 2 [Nowakowskiella sp. JEL0078]
MLRLRGFQVGLRKSLPIRISSSHSVYSQNNVQRISALTAIGPLKKVSVAQPLRRLFSTDSADALTVSDSMITDSEKSVIFSKNHLEGTIWFNNAFPIIHNRFLLYLQRIFPQRSIEPEFSKMIPKLPGGAELLEWRLEKNEKEGGFYFHFKIANPKVDSDVAENSEALGVKNADHLATLMENSISSVNLPGKFNWIQVFAVRGEPWVEDLVARPPYRKLRVEFFGEDIPIEKLFKEFRRYGRIADIVTLPWSSKEQPRYAEIHFELSRDAASAKNCTHGDVIDGTRLSVHYEKVPILIALFAGITYIIFDPIRKFFIINKATDRFSLEKYFEELFDRLKLSQSLTKLSKSAVNVASLIMRRHDNDDTWLERKGEAEKLNKWLQESPDNFVLVTGAHGSGTEQLVAKAVKGRPYKIIIDCNELVDHPEETLLRRLASQLGFFPLFRFYNTIAGFGDMIVLSLTGLKAGLATTNEGQVDRLLDLTLHALSELGSHEQKKSKKQLEKISTDSGVLELEADRTYPVIVIHGFMNKPKAKNAFIYDRLVEWGAMLEENKIAHIVFVSDNPGQSPKALQKGTLPTKTLELIVLADADNESSLSYVQRRLGLVFASAELQSAVEGLGGRLTDLEILVQKVKAGACATDAYNEIILRSISEIRKVGFGDDSEEAGKISWRPEQCWKIIQLLSKYDEVSLDEVKSHPLFGGDESSLQQMEVSRPYTIRPARPIYRTAFARMTADTKLSAAMNIILTKRLHHKEMAKINEYEKEMEILTRIMSGNGAVGDGRFISSREGRRGIESRLDYLAKLLNISSKKCEKFETDEEKFKGLLKLAD